MATFLDLSRDLSELNNAAAALMLQREALLNYFDWQIANGWLVHEVAGVGINTDGVSARQLNTGYGLVNTTGNSELRYKLGIYGNAIGEEALNAQHPNAARNRAAARMAVVKKAAVLAIDDFLSIGNAPRTILDVISADSYCTANGRKVAMGTNGAPLSLTALAECCSQIVVDGGTPTIFMGDDMQSLFSALSAQQQIAGNLQITADQFGKPLMYFMGFRIVFCGWRWESTNGTGVRRLGFTATQGTNNNTTSVFVCSVGGGFYGLTQPAVMHQPNGVVIAATGEGKYAPRNMEAIDIPMGWCFESPTSIFQLSGITKAPVVA